MKPARRYALLLTLAAMSALLFTALRPAEAITPEEALADYGRLKRHLSEAWANMEWIAGHRGVDLKAADQRTTAALRQVGDAEEAREILIGFVRSFRDPHLHARPVKPSMLERLVAGGGREAPPEITAEMSGRKVCKALGFDGRDLDFGLKLSSLDGYEPVKSRDDNPFQAALVPLNDGHRAAFLRIAHFGEDGYPEACREAWEEYRKTMEGACTNGWCAGFRTAVRDRLLAYLADRIRAMDERGYDLLVVDITGNGGGTDWVQAAARIVAPERLACNRFSMVRHPHWTKILEDLQKDVRGDLERRDELGPEIVKRLEQADGNVQEMIDQTRAPCDRMALWEGRNPGCTNLVEGETYTCGLFPDLQPGDLDGVSWPGVLFKPLQNRYTPSVNTKPVAVLVDRGTASASEDFGSILQDNGAAVILGSRTYGAGCGFVNGGIPLILEKVGLRVMAPDCIRYRKDGTNEIEGIAPDVDLGWQDDSARKRTSKLVAALHDLPLSP